MMRSSDCPSASVADHPTRSAAASFQEMTLPSASAHESVSEIVRQLYEYGVVERPQGSANLRSVVPCVRSMRKLRDFFSSLC
jgi:hypothetical protein